MLLNGDGSVTLTRDEANVAWECVSACIDLNILTEGEVKTDAEVLMTEFAKVLR